METKTTIASLSRNISTEAEAYSYLETLRWGETPDCGHCDSENVYLIQCRNGVSRKTRTGSDSERRVWKCRACKRQFSVLTNTVLHGTKIPVRTWILIYFEMAASKNGVAAREIERKYGFCPRTAWFVLHRLREAMANNDSFVLMFGTIVSDEAWIGGDPKNRHAWKRDGKGRSHHHKNKTPVVSLINRETGEVRSKVVSNVTGHTLMQVIKSNVSMNRSHLQTDLGAGYSHVAWLFASHSAVNHNAGEYVAEDGASTNPVEGYFSQLKRSLDGTHHHVSKEHLHRYVGEFDFRYTTCDMKDADRMALMAQRSKRRLTYKMTKA